MASTMTSSFTENNLTKFKKYLDNPDSEINKYVGENGILYSYNIKFGVYTKDPDGTFVNTDGRPDIFEMFGIVDILDIPIIVLIELFL